jgi:hypothetical protein
MSMEKTDPKRATDDESTSDNDQQSQSFREKIETLLLGLQASVMAIKLISQIITLLSLIIKTILQ